MQGKNGRKIQFMHKLISTLNLLLTLHGNSERSSTASKQVY